MYHPVGTTPRMALLRLRILLLLLLRSVVEIVVVGTTAVRSQSGCMGSSNSRSTRRRVGTSPFDSGRARW